MGTSIEQDRGQREGGVWGRVGRGGAERDGGGAGGEVVSQ